MKTATLNCKNVFTILLFCFFGKNCNVSILLTSTVYGFTACKNSVNTVTQVRNNKNLHFWVKYRQINRSSPLQWRQISHTKTTLIFPHTAVRWWSQHALMRFNIVKMGKCLPFHDQTHSAWSVILLSLFACGEMWYKSVLSTEFTITYLQWKSMGHFTRNKQIVKYGKGKEGTYVTTITCQCCYYIIYIYNN